MSFNALFDAVAAASVEYKKTYHHALTIGITPRELVLYAKGELRGPDRDAFERRLIQSPWALGRVVALVKAGNEGSYFTRLLILKAHTRPCPWPDEDLEGCKILDLIKSN